jgi:hypothetical protein
MSGCSRSALAVLLMVCSLGARPRAQEEVHSSDTGAKKIPDAKPNRIPKPGATNLVPPEKRKAPSPSTSPFHPPIKLRDNKGDFARTKPSHSPSELGLKLPAGLSVKSAFSQDLPDTLNPEHIPIPNSTATYKLNFDGTYKFSPDPVYKLDSIYKLKLDPIGALDQNHSKKTTESGPGRESDSGHHESPDETHHHHHHEGHCEKLRGIARESCEEDAKKDRGTVQGAR